MAEQIAANPVDVEPEAMPAAPKSQSEAKGESLFLRAVDGLWRLLRRPWLLVVLLVLLGATLLWARMLPQIPGQLTESAADGTRWLNATLASTSIPGADLARSLSLFDLYASPWLRLLLALVTLLATVQLADAIGALRLWRRLERRAFVGEVGEPAELSGSGMLRERIALEEVPEAVESTLRTWAEATRYAIAEGEVRSMIATADEAQGGQEQVEKRLLLRRRGRSSWLAPLLAAGALLGALLLWANVFWAWNLRPDTLAPGASFESEQQGFAVTNHLESAQGNEIVAPLFGGSTATVPVDGAWHSLEPLGWTHMRASADTPALVVSAEGAILSLPSAPTPKESVGVLLPGLGSEQFVVLPGQGIGLRLVRISDGNEDQFWAEVYGEDSVQPIVRQQIDGPGELDIPLGNETLTLEIAPASGLQIEIERGFGRWFWLPALLMILAGILALILPARMLLMQLSPWEKERTLLIAQGTSHKELDAVTTLLNP